MIPDPGGNCERIAYIYDKRAVTFTVFAATANPPRTKKGAEYLPDRFWWRPPDAASFQAGDFDFVVIEAHIRWGDDNKARRAWVQINTGSDDFVLEQSSKGYGKDRKRGWAVKFGQCTSSAMFRAGCEK